MRNSINFTIQKGQSLVETIVALSVLIVGFMGLLALLTRSLAISNFVSENYIATYLASEGIEVVRNLADYNALRGGIAWNEGLVGVCPCEIEFSSSRLDVKLVSSKNRKLLLDAATGLYSYNDGGAPTKFVRIIYIGPYPNPDSQDRMRVKSVVTWDSSGGIAGAPIHSEVNLEDHFFSQKAPL